MAYDKKFPVFELDGLMFGGEETLRVHGFEPNGPDARTQDVENEVGDGMYFGRDTLGTPAWAFELHTDLDSGPEAHDLADLLAAKWLDPDLRGTPGRVVALRYWMAGRWRRVYGRPRRYVGLDGGWLTAVGRGEMTADFKLAHHLHYDDVAKEVEVGMVPATVGGFIFPVIFPLSTARRGVGERSNQLTVGGTAPTWPKITVNGPIRNAKITVSDWSMRMVGNIAYDQAVTIDTAPWARTITRENGASVAGMLHPTVSMAGLELRPGFHNMILEGTDLTGTATATIEWRDAHYGL